MDYGLLYDIIYSLAARDGRDVALFGESAPRAQEATGELMACLEGWGLADRRWRALGDTTFAKRASHEAESLLLFCFPAFVKLRWRDAEPLDAKAHLMAGAQ